MGSATHHIPRVGHTRRRKLIGRAQFLAPVGRQCTWPARFWALLSTKSLCFVVIWISLYYLTKVHSHFSNSRHLWIQVRFFRASARWQRNIVIAFLSNGGITFKHKKLVPWGTDGRLPLSYLDLGSGHTAYRRASLIDLYLHTETAMVTAR